MKRSNFYGAAAGRMLLGAALGGLAAAAIAASGSGRAGEQRAPAAVPATTAPDQSAPLAVAGSLKPGLWEIRSSEGAGETVQRLCLADPSTLVQLRHRRPGCGRLVLANDPGIATVQYNCPGAGWGRTSLRAVGQDNVRIETQGIAANAPFEFSAVARRAGDCDTLAQTH